MIIGVTDEAVDVVDKWVASKKKTGYPIVILNGDLEKVLGVPHFPFNGVIEPDGKISYAGDSPESALKKAMKSAKGGSMWPKKLASSATLLRAGKLGEAWVELQALKTAGGLDDREGKVCEKFVTYVSEESGAAVKAAEDLFKKDMVYAAVTRVQPIALAKPALPATEDAAKLLAEWKAIPTYEAEMKGGELYAAALSKEEAEDYAGAVNGYKDVIKKSEGTRIAGAATKKAEGLIKRGMPGYERECERCHKSKRACDKHAKPMKM